MSGEIVNNVEALSINVKNEDDDIVDPWTVASKSETGVDYDKLISKCILQYILG